MLMTVERDPNFNDCVCERKPHLFHFRLALVHLAASVQVPLLVAPGGGAHQKQRRDRTEVSKLGTRVRRGGARRATRTAALARDRPLNGGERGSASADGARCTARDLRCACAAGRRLREISPQL
jgi:hypothetical protein